MFTPHSFMMPTTESNIDDTQMAIDIASSKPTKTHETTDTAATRMRRFFTRYEAITASESPKLKEEAYQKLASSLNPSLFRFSFNPKSLSCEYFVVNFSNATRERNLLRTIPPLQVLPCPLVHTTSSQYKTGLYCVPFISTTDWLKKLAIFESKSVNSSFPSLLSQMVYTECHCGTGYNNPNLLEQNSKCSYNDCTFVGFVNGFPSI
mmetsp:Transcript_36367/g.42184  ORF Transcript_36367/g.42184 Transcript_36367/m.42184 type:complete len:207 (-) Transcript_36367:1584-2204(-)